MGDTGTALPTMNYPSSLPLNGAIMTDPNVPDYGTRPDPSKVKAGDRIKGESDGTEIGGKVSHITERGFVAVEHLGEFRIQGITDATHGYRMFVLTDHQPAPKPEWAPGTSGTATVRGVLNIRVMRLDSVTQPWVSTTFFAPAGDVKGEGQNRHDDWQVTDFVADEDRARLAVEQCRHLHQDGLTREEWHKAHCGAVQPLQDIGEFVAEIDTDILHDGSYAEILRAEFGALRRRLEQAERANHELGRALRGETTAAPIDPSQVAITLKSGDYIEAESDGAKIGGKVSHVNENGFVAIEHVGTFAIHHITASPQDGYRFFTLTDHQPAPEWKLGTTGTATTSIGADERVMRTTPYGPLGPVWVDTHNNRLVESEVTDFVPDETRPLPTREQVAQAVIHEMGLMAHEVEPMHYEVADAILALLRGESR